ncbi:MAG: hypothetical protein UDW72_01325 [Acutalibacteraceae bacterium]|jgi:hypothetical protein|nr:hypothetical protein [Acutalibacteraceae bacterium]DAQ58460.1 MAG TPA: hypothetical protein [Caudoviricetes sp.]DAV86287.1 MAG TPA: hypothetical protein [Caudoviricetes sp.]
MIKTELGKKLGTARETARQLEQETKQLTSRLEYVRTELIKQLGKIEMLNEMLQEEETVDDADNHDND